MYEDQLNLNMHESSFSIRYHRKFELIYASQQDLRRLGGYIKQRINLSNFLIDLDLVFDVKIHEFPRKNAKKWSKFTVPELHQLIRNGQMGFTLLDKENYNYFLDFSLGPYK